MSVRVSVILPLHNAVQYLDSAFRGLVELIGDDLEFIVVDDHSVDDTFQRLQDWSFRLISLKLIKASGRGVAAARNQAIEAATGEYVWFADCDDRWDVSIVRQMLSAAEVDGADIVVCNSEKVLVSGEREGIIEDAPRRQTIGSVAALQRLLVGDIQGHLWNKLFRRALFDTVRFPDTRAHSDLGGMLQLFQRAESLITLPSILYTYVLHAGSILNRREYRWEDLEDCLQIADRVVRETSGKPALGDALLLFKYRYVVVPLENELVRRERWEDSSTIRAVRSRNRHRIRISELSRLALRGRLPLVARAIIILIAPAAYRFAYRRYRLRSWASLDTA